jgi:hypothetical protein
MKYPEITIKELGVIAGFAVIIAGIGFLIQRNAVKDDQEKEVKLNFGMNEMQNQFNEQNESALAKIQEAWDKRNM